MDENHTLYKDRVREYLQNALKEIAEATKSNPYDLEPHNSVAYIMGYFDSVANYSNATESDLHETAKLCLSMWGVSDTSKQCERIAAIVERLKSELQAALLQSLPQPKNFTQPSESDQVKSIQEKLEETFWKISDDSERIHVSLDNFESFARSGVTLGKIKQFADLVYREFTTRKNWNDQNPDGRAIRDEMKKMRDEARQPNAADFQSFLQSVDVTSSTSDSEVESKEDIPAAARTEKLHQRLTGKRGQSIPRNHHLRRQEEIPSTAAPSRSADTPAQPKKKKKHEVSKGERCKKVISEIIKRLKKGKEREDLQSALWKIPPCRIVAEWAGCEYRTILGTETSPSNLQSVIKVAFDFVDVFRVDDAIHFLEGMEAHMEADGKLTEIGWNTLNGAKKYR